MMWKQLYLSIDLPHCDRSRDIRVSAFPGDFLAHLRNAVEMPLLCSASDIPHDITQASACLSNKVKALLNDLPHNELCVVFSSSKTTITHLNCVLEVFGIGCRALFSGQRVEASENALQDWQSTEITTSGTRIYRYSVLLVQAGAAASGLTLTAACKMFLMEPFLRFEEEQQAYARCHRYGQNRAVHYKCYYVPISVESRLLEWRKNASGSEHSIGSLEQSPQVVYSTFEEDKEVEGEQDSEDNQTAFLLGLNHHLKPCSN